jgi:hypothetical protein
MLKQICSVEELHPFALATGHEVDEHCHSQQLLEGAPACRPLGNDEWQQLLDSGVGPGILTGQGGA